MAGVPLTTTTHARDVLDDATLLRTAAFVDGAWVSVGESGSFPVDDPATGHVLAELPSLSREQVAGAIEAADRALPAWRALSGKDRSRVLRRWFDLVTEHSEDLARIIVLEEGKPLAEARGEVAYAASFIEWFAEEAKRVRGEIFDAPQASGRVVVLKEPVGVCVAITPWNFPAAMITRKAAPALAAGCTMVVKPAEQTPLTALALAELAVRAGVPAGVLSVVTGDARAIGPELTGNPLVRKLTFTGSTEVGRLLLAQAAATVKKTSMELGGNAPIIVFDDADIETAVAGVMTAKFRNSGESCIGGNRVYVQAGVYDQFATALAERTAALHVAAGLEEGAQIGPLIDSAAVAKVTEHIADATARGARVLAGGSPHERGGKFFEPTVLADVVPGMLLTREETFGPVLPLIRFENEAQVVSWANDTEYGLAAYLFTKDAERTWRVAGAIEAGMVGINTGLISNEIAPFGGIKQSGLGREGSIHGIEEYLEMKYLAWEGSGTAVSAS
jgi:succinate-semialdehyde dehydrogenase / glutarate-semialdehyde dehydrogenase